MVSGRMFYARTLQNGRTLLRFQVALQERTDHQVSRTRQARGPGYEGTVDQ
jgi:hypothetical protein